MHASKTKQHYQFFSKPLFKAKITRKAFVTLVMGGDPAQSISQLREGLPCGEGMGCTSVGLRGAAGTQCPALRRRFPAPCPADGCRGPARARKATQMRWRRTSCSATTQPLQVQQPSWKNFTDFFTLKASALQQTPQMQPQPCSDPSDSVAH